MNADPNRHPLPPELREALETVRLAVTGSGKTRARRRVALALIEQRLVEYERALREIADGAPLTEQSYRQLAMGALV